MLEGEVTDMGLGLGGWAQLPEVLQKILAFSADMPPLFSHWQPVWSRLTGQDGDADQDDRCTT